MASQAWASRSRMQTCEPSSKNRAAVAAPIPLAPPVMRTRLSFRPRMVEAPLLPEWTPHGADESGLVIENGEAEFLAAFGHVYINRHHHAFVQKLLVGACVKSAVDFE